MNRYCRWMFLLLGLSLVGCSAAPSTRVKNTPYTIKGVRYQPYSVAEARSIDEVGLASWYGPDRSLLFGWLGRSEITANGEEVTSRSLSAAHRLLPLPSIVEVTNLRNGRRVKLRVNDRGPFVHGRLLDVSSRAAEKLGFKGDGLTEVRVRVLRVGDA